MNLRNPRLLLLALAALFVPLQAGALDGGKDPAAQVEISIPLSVSASLGQCGTVEESISCQVTISWSGVTGADYYTAVVTSPDGAYIPLGTVGTGDGAGSTSVWIPYSGDGSYSISVIAWAYDAEGKPEKVGKGKSGGKKGSKAATEPVDVEVKTDKPAAHKGQGSGGSGGKRPDGPPDSGPKPAQPDVKVEPEPTPTPAPPESSPAPAPEPPVPEPTPEPAPEPPAPAPVPDDATPPAAAA